MHPSYDLRHRFYKMATKEPLIKKKILYAGTKNVSFTEGTKVQFHFTTRKCDYEKTLIDDSREMKRPMELVLGKKFKLEVWESIVQNMSLNEVAHFTVHQSLLAPYPFVSKTLRDSMKPKEQRHHHCCGVTAQNPGTGYEDLNALLNDPCDLEFTIELLKVEAPEEYKREAWQMSEEEKLKTVPQLKDQGNELYRAGDYLKAADKYAEALGLLEQLMLKEKPGDTEWKSLETQQIPLLLNYSQCKLNEGDFYPVIEHCTSVLNTDPDNVKALFRRGRAHLGAWNPQEAKQDFLKVAQLQPTMMPCISEELKKIELAQKEQDAEDRKKLSKLF